MAIDNLKELVEKYLMHNISMQEKKQLFSLLEYDHNRTALGQIIDEQLLSGLFDIDANEELGKLLFSKIQEHKNHEAPVKKINWYKRIAIAASILLVIGLGSYFVFFNKKSQTEIATVDTKDIEAPKNTKATITLADGRVISIDSLNSLTQGEVIVTKTADGKVVYSQESGVVSQIQYNTLSNPRGSKVVDLNLADGSHVWLNAGSSITYPIAFVNNERKVSIDGEAYFEVAKDPTKKFSVVADDVTTEVLGTHFNINSYNEEQETKVTLLEGSVQVSAPSAKNSAPSAVKIKPGQQAVLTPDSELRTLNSVDLDEVMAWKNGRFQFNKATVVTIMREIARWYNVEVVYEGKIPTGYFRGEIPRTVTLLQTMKILQTSGVKVRIEGNKVFVSN